MSDELMAVADAALVRMKDLEQSIAAARKLVLRATTHHRIATVDDFRMSYAAARVAKAAMEPLIEEHMKNAEVRRGIMKQFTIKRKRWSA